VRHVLHVTQPSFGMIQEKPARVVLPTVIHVQMLQIALPVKPSSSGMIPQYQKPVPVAWLIATYAQQLLTVQHVPQVSFGMTLEKHVPAVPPIV
ncbi:MAG: hypothetical protein QF535_08365, partial [Anaerolineales bacterium]|nr:hypothetical protein [Anaerolineales bacterium]